MRVASGSYFKLGHVLLCPRDDHRQPAALARPVWCRLYSSKGPKARCLLDSVAPVLADYSESPERGFSAKLNSIVGPLDDLTPMGFDQAN